jgi:hypothetical protein
MSKPTKRQIAADRQRVNAAYGRVANGVLVPIMSLGRIMVVLSGVDVLSGPVAASVPVAELVARGVGRPSPRLRGDMKTITLTEEQHLLLKTVLDRELERWPHRVSLQALWHACARATTPPAEIPPPSA